MNLLTANHLHLSLSKKTVVDDVTLQIQQKEFIGLIGPNGAGKSSLLRMLAGLVKPSRGDVHLHFADVGFAMAKISLQKRARFMAYLAQHELPAWPLSVNNLVALGRLPWNENAMAFGAEASQQHDKDDAAAIEQAMQMTDVAVLAERPITELSGGELQRVLLARVFAGKPELIVADEPIVSLDVYHQLHLMEILQAHAIAGGAVIAALHDLSLAARFCTRLILLHKGQVIAEGEPVSVLTPENLAKVYGISAYVDCREEGVVIIPKQRI